MRQGVRLEPLLKANRTVSSGSARYGVRIEKAKERSPRIDAATGSALVNVKRVKNSDHRKLRERITDAMMPGHGGIPGGEHGDDADACPQVLNVCLDDSRTEALSGTPQVVVEGHVPVHDLEDKFLQHEPARRRQLEGNVEQRKGRRSISVILSANNSHPLSLSGFGHAGLRKRRPKAARVFQRGRAQRGFKIPNARSRGVAAALHVKAERCFHRLVNSRFARGSDNAMIDRRAALFVDTLGLAGLLRHPSAVAWAALRIVALWSGSLGWLLETIRAEGLDTRAWLRLEIVDLQLNVAFQRFDIPVILACGIAFIAIVQAIEILLLQPLEATANQWRR